MTAFPADWRQRIEAMLARAEDADALDLIESWIAGSQESSQHPEVAT
ncbi:MAG: hypothetical protein ACRDQG_12145 [Pseudonocardiaceae bacterium]